MRTRLLCTALAALTILVTQVRADTLRSVGVLGNSGEQGASLVRFGAKPATGLGVVYDEQGSLWDRGGQGVLNRYAPDGRQLGSVTIPTAPNSLQSGDALVGLGDRLVFKLGRKLYSLPVNAPDGTAPMLLPVEATRLSLGSNAGWAAAARDTEVFLINAKGETKPVATADATVEDVELGPDGGVFIRIQGKMLRVDAAAPSDQRGPWPAPGDRVQWLDGHWFAVSWHGTIRRFDTAFMPAPGVVLGGASGSFIGYVEGNSELELGRGLARLSEGLYAISGKEGVMHLLQWSAVEKRFKIIRRLGAIASCGGLAIDDSGRIWATCGTWNWTDNPDAPLHDCVPAPEPPGIWGAVMLPGGVMVAPAMRWGQKTFYAGKLDGPVGSPGGVDTLPKDGVACALITRDKRQVLVVVDRMGVGAAFFVSGAGRHEGSAGAFTLEATTPLKELTSLTTTPAGNLLAAADGQLVEFVANGTAWRESRRWSSWGTGPAARFGGRVFVAASSDRIWVSDTDQHRVLCFDLSSGEPLLAAGFGTVGRPGDDLSSLRNPQTLAVNGRRAVVFDAGNQRLMRLELSTP